MDVGDEAGVGALFSELPPLFAVVHAAAVNHDALLLRHSEAAWREVLRVDADGAFLVARAALGSLPGSLQQGGRLIFLTSRVGEHGAAGQAAYAAAKAALIALTRSCAREGAARGLCVNAICPGFVPSAMDSAMSHRVGAARQDALRRQSVFASFGTARQVAATVQWLLSDDAAGISGQVIPCDSRI
jgi:3-oxoacyl-[acyl-carrier protein] reductase